MKIAMPRDASSFGCPLISLACAMIGGIVMGYEWPDHRIWAYCGAAGCLLALSVTLYRRRPCLGSPLFLFIALGYLLIQPWVAPRFASGHVVHLIGKGPCTFVGWVESSPRINNLGQQFNLRTEYVLQDNKQIAVCGILRVTVSRDAPLLFAGDRIQFNGVVGALRNFKNPGGFDYKRYMATQGVWASSYARTNGLLVLARATGGGFQGLFNEKRRQIANFLETFADKKTVGVFETLLIGDHRNLQETTRLAFQRTGIGHLLAISGLHIGIVGSVVFFLSTRILIFFPWFIGRGWVRKGGAVVAVIAVLNYGALAGMSPSTQRAVWMISVLFLSIYVGRAHVLLNAVAIAAIVVLVVNPPSLLSISFQLSFSAVTAIILGLNALKTVSGPHVSMGAAVWGKLAPLCWVSTYAFLGTLPLIMFYFQQVSLLGLLANLLFVPLIGYGVLPLGLLSSCLYFVSPIAAAQALCPAKWLLSAAITLAEKMADWPLAGVMTVAPSLFEMGLYYTVLLLLMRYFAKKTSADNAALSKRQWRGPLIMAGVVFALVIIDIGFWCYQRFWRQDLQVTILDVGDGSASLLELPGGSTMLIDGGGFSDNSVFDVGKSIISPFLLRKKILTVDEIILSHPNSDHMNGLIFIAEHFHVKRLKFNNETADTESYRRLIEIVQFQKIQMPEFSSAPRIENKNGVTFKFLYPPADYRSKKMKEIWRTENNNSLVVQVRFGAHAFLFPGDIEAEAETELVKIAGDALRSDVLIAPHHGSRTSGSIGFLNKVQPQRVVISTGARRRQIRPHPEALGRYRQACSIIYCTATQGAIRFITDGRRLQVWDSE
jgi:competence protein ComEC